MPSLRADSIAKVTDMPLTAATERLTAATRRSVLPYSIYSSYSISLTVGVFTNFLLRKE